MTELPEAVTDKNMPLKLAFLEVLCKVSFWICDKVLKNH